MDASHAVGDPVPPSRDGQDVARAVRAFVLDVVLFVVLMLAISVAFVAAWFVVAKAGAGAAGLDPGARPTLGLLPLLAMTSLATGGGALILYRTRRRATPAERAASLRAVGERSTWIIAGLVGVGLFAASTAAHRLMSAAGVEVQASNVPFIEEGLLRYPGVLLLFAVLLAPAYEELLFRRVLFGRLLAAGRPWLGMVLSSAVFALLHELPGSGGNAIEATVLLWLLYGAMGAAFAWVYWRTGTLWAAIGAHALNNLLACLTMFATT